jgi:hypothetical protein
MMMNVQVRRKIGVAVWLRLCVIMVAIAALLGVAAGSTAPEHLHAKAPAGGGCDICFAAHIASPQAASSVRALPAPEVTGSVSLYKACPGYQFVRSSSPSTRGPPSSQL